MEKNIFLDEKKFKENFINRLNDINPGWRDGDKDNFTGKKADIVNDKLKIVIEIKDDTKYKMIIPSTSEIIGNLTKLNNKNRQFKDDIKNANEKFLNYDGYKSIVLLRTEMSNRNGDVIEYTISGPKIISGGGVYRPSTFFGEHDESTKEVGVILFWGSRIFYRENTNPNVVKNRIIRKQELERIMGVNM